MASEEYLLELTGVTKRFPGTLALDHVQLKVRRGETLALMGENGAGKSTLMKIIIGMLKPDTGEIFFDGQKVNFSGPTDSITAGISMIHQELNPILHMTIAENIFLHREPMRGPFLNKSEQNDLTAKILKQFDMDLDPKAKMNSLTIAQMQMVEIIKAVTFHAKLVIMDEPTSSLDSEETEHLFKTIHDLKEKGISIIYISHRMDEIFRVSDAVTVFRDGKYVGTNPVGELDNGKLIKMMVGRDLSEVFDKPEIPLGETVLEVESFCKKGQFQDISFSVREGEILGFSGLVGAGRSEVMASVFGLQSPDSGKMRFLGRNLRVRNVAHAISEGIAMVTEDRKEYGLVLCRSLRENISLPNLKRRQKGLVINRAKENRDVEEIARQLSVKSSGLSAPVSSLSGGNQQKVVLAKWLMSRPKLIILDEPTRGIDIGAKSEIYKLVFRLASEGLAIILISSEMQEVMGLSDRIIVMHEGRMTGEFDHDGIAAGDVTQEDLLSKAFEV